MRQTSISGNNSLQTERLTLRPLAPADIPAFFAMFSDARAMRFMPTLPHRTTAETKAYLQAEIGRAGAHFWAVCLQENDRPIGYVQFLGDPRLPGMGYMVHPDYWGQGIAPEACGTALTFGFDRLGYDRVELWIDETNAASQRVAAKLGFQRKGRIPLKFAHESTPHFILVFGIMAQEWRGETAAVPTPDTRFFWQEPVLMVHDVQQTAVFYQDKLGFNIDFLFGDPPYHGAVSRGEWTGSMGTF